ncbi:F-box domain-containing protein [Pleurotus pulmonarius]
MTSTRSQELEDLYDAKIDAHFAEIRLLRSQRNADCSKTKNLPPEILSTIFGMLHRDIAQHSYQKWIGVTHVCRTWRNTALDDPSLWSNITVVPSKWIPEAFARSKAAPLDLRQGGYYDAGDKLDFIFDHVAEHPERIKRLHFHGEPAAFINSLTKPAPFLEHVSTTGDVDFPPDFLGGIAPRLKSVSCGGSLPLEATWLANLTRLECQRVHLGAAYLSNLISLELRYNWDALDAAGGVVPHINIDLLLSALQNMPLLQRLSLSLPTNFSDAPSNRSTPIHLHHLRDICVSLPRPKMAFIFNHLRVDSIERLETSWPLYFKDTDMIEPVCRFFNECYHGSNLSYLLQESHALEMHRFVGSTPAHTPVLLFRSFRPTDLAIVVNMLPLCVPRIFATDKELPFKSPFPLADCDTIEELHVISKYSTSTVLEFSDEPSIPYPSLRQLHLERVSFVPKAKRIPPLKRWISKRKSGTKIELLVLKNCGLSDKDIASLQKVVTVVGS